MRILHCCLAAFYIDGYGYQENILPRIHQEMGHDVKVIASTETYLQHTKLGYVEPKTYVSPDGVNVTRLPYAARIPAKMAQKLRIYTGLDAELRRFRPDIIFIHDVQFLSASVIVSYAKESGAIVFADTHTDYINSGRSFVSRHILHGLIYRYSARQIESVATRIYATLPLRKEFLVDVYGLKPEGIALLPFGADDSRIDISQRDAVRSEIRRELQIAGDDLVFVTGGKIDKRKNIYELLEVFCGLVDQGKLARAKLLLFGKPTDEMAPMIKPFLGHKAVRYVEWLPAADIYRYLWASDVAVFPGTHSVLWEEAIGFGLPCIARRWHGIEHIDLGGNCIFLERSDRAEIGQVLQHCYDDPADLARLRAVAATRGSAEFSYKAIAQRAITLGA